MKTKPILIAFVLSLLLWAIALYSCAAGPGVANPPGLSQIGTSKNFTPSPSPFHSQKSQHKCFVQEWDQAETNSQNGSTQITTTKWVNTIEYSELGKSQLKIFSNIRSNMTIVGCVLYNIPLSLRDMTERNLEEHIDLQEGEIWKPTVQCPQHYWVSSHGRIFSWKEKLGKPIGLLKTGTHSLGYRVVSLDYQSPMKVHRVVATAFIDNPDNNPEVNHKDHNKQNNRVDNLEWVTHSENIQASYDGGFRASKRGNQHHMHGKSPSESTRAAMSAAKMGEKHPQFKGWYIIDGTKYPSANQAGKAIGKHAMFVSRRCANPNFPNWEFVPKEDLKPNQDS